MTGDFHKSRLKKLGLSPDSTLEAGVLGALANSCGVPTNRARPLMNESPLMRSNKLAAFHDALRPLLGVTSSIAVLAMLIISASSV